MKTLLTIISFVLFAMIVTPAQAGGNRIKDYEILKETGGKKMTFPEIDLMLLRLIGAYEAIGWVNVLYMEEKKPPVFCPPDDYVLTVADLKVMLDTEIRDHTYSDRPYPDDMPMEAIVMFAAQAKFPCR